MFLGRLHGRASPGGGVPTAPLACVSHQQVRHRALRTAANAADDQLAHELGSTVTALPRVPQLLERMKGFDQVQKQEQLRVKPPTPACCAAIGCPVSWEEFPFSAAQIRLPWWESCLPTCQRRGALGNRKVH